MLISFFILHLISSYYRGCNFGFGVCICFLISTCHSSGGAEKKNVRLIPIYCWKKRSLSICESKRRQSGQACVIWIWFCLDKNCLDFRIVASDNVLWWMRNHDPWLIQVISDGPTWMVMSGSVTINMVWWFFCLFFFSLHSINYVGYGLR